MVLLAKQETGQFLKGEAIAKETKVPEAYLAKILQALNRAGLVCAQKGKGGGYALNQQQEKISLYQIINAVYPFERITRCPLGIAEHTSLCPLHKKLDAAYAEFEQIFADCTLHQLK